jgi:stringent starvation protein B
MSTEMTPSRPYLIRALYEWILDNDMTPYLLVSASEPDVVVPERYVQDGRIVLNVAPHAVSHLDLGNESLTFEARFAGVSESIYIPVNAVLAIYAMENGQGMVFTQEGEGDGGPSDTPPDAPAGGDKPTRPSLKVVK